MSATTTRKPHDDDASVAIRAAQDEIERTIQVGGLTGDPLAHVLRVQATVLGAMHQLYLDGAKTLADQMANAPHPVSLEDLRKANAEQLDAVEQKVTAAMTRSGQEIARRCLVGVDRRAAMLFGAAVVLAGAICGGVGYWAGAKASGPVEVCWKADGQTVCGAAVWLTQPGNK